MNVTAEATRCRRTLMILGTASCAVLPLSSSPAVAQEDVQSRSVAERNAPEFTNRPIRYGAFEIFPEILAEAEYNDNILALDSRKVDDVVFSLRPRVLIRDNRPDREIRINLSAGINKYLDTDTEDNEQLRAAIEAQWGRGTSTQYRVGADISRNTERRRDIDSFTDLVQPINFTNLQANGGITQEFGALSASVDVRARSVEYGGSTVIDGTSFDLGFRDFQIYTGQARLSYSRSRAAQIYVQLTADERNYGTGPNIAGQDGIFQRDRSSSGGRLEVGYRQQVTQLLYLDVRAGYLTQDFDDPLLPTVDGVAFQADLLWNATPLTSVKLSGVRRVDETINPRFSGLVRTEVGVQVEHELLRNFIVIGRGNYARLNPGDAFASADQYEIGVSADYRLDRHWAVTFDAERFERNGLFDLTQNRASIGLRYAF